MTYQEARKWLAEVSKRGSLLGLDSIRLLLKELGSPQDGLKFIHIAGTNGKGSVMTFLEETLLRAGFRVGRYLSPVLFAYEEKIQVDRTCISKDELTELTAAVREAVKRIEERHEPLPTIFEVETAMAFLYFVKEKCDLVLLETGMGGREDATNIVTTVMLTVFSSISMDHMEYLGDTIEKIARNKAGIIKPGVPSVSDDQPAGAALVLKEAAEENHAPIFFADPGELKDVLPGFETQRFSYKSHRNIRIHMAGLHQIRNAAVALEALDALRRQGMVLPETAIREGFEAAVWAGRFQLLWKKPLVIMDGAHNADAARCLRDSLEAYFPKKKKRFVFGVFKDKEYDRIIRLTAPLAEEIFTIETRNSRRALPARDLAEAVRKVNPRVTAAGNCTNALETALAHSGEDDMIVIFGSLSFLWEARQFFSSGKENLLSDGG